MASRRQSRWVDCTRRAAPGQTADAHVRRASDSLDDIGCGVLAQDAGEVHSSGVRAKVLFERLDKLLVIQVVVVGFVAAVLSRSALVGL